MLNRYSKTIDINPKSFANAYRVSDMIKGIIEEGLNYFDLIIPIHYKYLTDYKLKQKVEPQDLELFNRIQIERDKNLQKFYNNNSFEPDEGVKGTIMFWQNELIAKYVKLEF